MGAWLEPAAAGGGRLAQRNAAACSLAGAMSLYLVLGLDTRTTFHDRLGRPHPVLDAAMVVAEFVGS